MQVGARIKALRKHYPLSQAALAHRAGIAQTTISALERGQQLPDVETIEALARALGIEPGELSGEEPPAPAVAPPGAPLSGLLPVTLPGGLIELAQTLNLGFDEVLWMARTPATVADNATAWKQFYDWLKEEEPNE